MDIMRCTAAMVGALFTCTALLHGRVSGSAAAVQLYAAAAMHPNPVISRGAPAFSGGGKPAYANDSSYDTAWESGVPDYLAYDLSGIPAAQRQSVIAVWYNESTYDNLGKYVTQTAEPTDYVIEVNAAAGGTLPASGWKTAVSVQSNTRSSRQHLVELGGCGWIRLRVTKAVGSKIKLNFDIHDASQGVSDSWIFIGDSITQCGMVNQTGTGFAAHIHALNPDYYPAAENAGISGLTSADGKASIDGWLDGSPVRYVSIAYGTNDCWGHSDGAASFYANTKYMIDAVLKRGKIPVLPTIPYASSQKVGPNLPACSKMVQQLYAEYGSRLVHGPDLETFFREHPDLLSSDGIHPSEEGYAAMRKLWAETMYAAVYAEPAAVTGDLNADGLCDIADVKLLRDFLTAKITLGETAAAAADLDQNGKLNAADLTLLKRLILRSV